MKSARGLARSKAWRHCVAASFLILHSSFLLCASAQSYSVNWYKVAGGGGTSSNGQHALSGTIGQADAGTLSGGGYTLSGGFWSGAIALQTPGAPTLTIRRVGDNVVISWPLPADGWALRESAAVAGTGVSWNPTAQARATNASTISVTVPSPTGIKFYRLQDP